MIVAPVLFGEDTNAALQQLARDRPHLSQAITDLGNNILNLPHVGFRKSDSQSYDAAFVRAEPGRRALEFVQLIVPSQQRSRLDLLSGHPLYKLRTRVRVNPDVGITDKQNWLRNYNNRGPSQCRQHRLVEWVYRQQWVWN